MTDRQRKNLRVLALAAVLIASTTIPMIYSPSLYRAFCAATGYGGAVRQAEGGAPAEVVSGEMVTVYFDANVDPGLPWTFKPEQRSVQVPFGQAVTIYYDATNRSDRTIVGRAVYNVSPYKAAPYFFKIACFCFTNERLGPGETARMPVELYVDEQLLADRETREVREITLSYTFYAQDQLTQEEIDDARDLATGSETLDRQIDADAPVVFDNDAPRE